MHGKIHGFLPYFHVVGKMLSSLKIPRYDRVDHSDRAHRKSSDREVSHLSTNVAL